MFKIAIIVKHRESGKVYALIGTGYGAYKATRPSLLGGNLFPHEEAGEIPVAAVSDEKGNIEWFYTDDLQVYKIDGQDIGDFLAPFAYTEPPTDDSPNICPACQATISIEDKECPSCGLVFVDEEE